MSRVLSSRNFFFQAEDGIRYYKVTGVQTCALPISPAFVKINVVHDMNHSHECTGRRPEPAARPMISTLVIGGGIGGLSLARELAIRGLPVTVLEKAPQLNPVGAGIIMNPNAMRVLERNGLAEAVRLDSWPYLVRETCDSRGRSLAMRDYRPLYEAGKLSVGALVHRAHLLDVLYRSLPPAAVCFNVGVTNIDVL